MTVLGPSGSLFKGRMPAIAAAAATLLFLFAVLHPERHNLPDRARGLISLSSSGRAGGHGQPPLRHPHARPKGRPKARKPAARPVSRPSTTESKSGAAMGDWWSSAKSKLPTKEPSFMDVARKTGTDKVTTHKYHEMYGIYLQPRRHEQIKMLEIGLGCTGNKPGASYSLWTEFFPNVDLYFIESDRQCALAYAYNVKRATVIQGDQQDGGFLDKFMQDNGTDFDIIIDDGGHTMAQQQVSLQHLWKAIKPGGLYFIEDLQTSWEDAYGGGEAARTAKVMTTVQYIHRMIEDLTKAPRQIEFPEVEKIVHIDCGREMCVFEKRKP